MLFDSHRRFRERLSAYIDAQLPAEETAELEAHLQSCESCRQELEELRYTVFALRDMPELEAPRSFALSPQQAARPSPPAKAGVPQLATGMRLASAAVAFVLAVVVVADLGTGGDGGERDAGGLQDVEMQAADHAPGERDFYGLGGEAEPKQAATPEAEDAGQGRAGGAGGADETEDQQLDSDAGVTPEPAPPADLTDRGLEPAQPGEEMEALPAANGADGDGAGVLRAAEIGLAALLVLLLLGSVAVSRRSASGRRQGY